MLLDAACLVAAVATNRGGSRFVVSLCVRGYLMAVLAPHIVLEAERNAESKLGDLGLVRLRRDVAAMAPDMADQAPMPEEVGVNQKDVHVAADAMGGKVDFPSHPRPRAQA